MVLYEVKGAFRERMAAAVLQKEGGSGTFSLETSLPGTGLYAIGENPRTATLVVLGDTEELTLTGNCQNQQQGLSLAGSGLNDAYSELIGKVIEHNTTMQQLQQNLQIFSQTDPNQVPRIQQDMQNANNTYFSYLDSAVARTDIVGKIAQMYNFRPFMSDPAHSRYGSEVEYFKGEFFNGFDPNDPEVAKLPQLFEKSQAYAGNVAAIFPREEAKTTLDAALAKATDGSDGYQSILRGFLAGLEMRKSDVYVDYANLFAEKFPNDKTVPEIQAVAESMKRLMVGSTAPDISNKTPEGGTLALSELRGQYVLLDFWASWCRPCRMENPNVVKAYNKYHKSGFEILGVSLDQKRDKWLQAIEQDGLPWKHISDLGGWQSQPAAAYGISSIPATFLLDKDGVIIGKNLRGQALEAKLSELFGY